MSYAFDISVFITCFNKGQYIEAALESLLNQENAPNFELIILDDASTDDSWQKIQAFVNRQKLQAIHASRNDKNMGLASGIVYGISNASGKYFCRFDGDDIWYPNALRELYSAAEKYKSNSAFGDVDLINKNGEITNPHPNLTIPSEKYLSSWSEKILRRNFICGSAFIARTSAWKSALPIPEGINATIDWYFNISILADNNTTRIQNSLAAYRIHEGNLHRKSLSSGQKLATWLILRNKFLIRNSNRVNKKNARRIRIGCEFDLLSQLLGAGQYKMARGCIWRIGADGSILSLIHNFNLVFHSFAPGLYNGIKKSLKIRKP